MSSWLIATLYYRAVLPHCHNLISSSTASVMCESTRGTHSSRTPSRSMANMPYLHSSRIQRQHPLIKIYYPARPVVHILGSYDHFESEEPPDIRPFIVDSVTSAFAVTRVPAPAPPPLHLTHGPDDRPALPATPAPTLPWSSGLVSPHRPTRGRTP